MPPEYIALADSDFDLAKATYEAAEASLDGAKATTNACKAALELAQANLDYTEIKSPVDGVVVDRKVDPGQTVAAQFQTPDMFVVAPEMDKRMLVLALVDEADIGQIYAAYRRKQLVQFTVDAYPDDLFTGMIQKEPVYAGVEGKSRRVSAAAERPAGIRLNPTTTSNVVTYTVVVEAPNPALKLLPGMTANLSFRIDQRKDVLRIPNAALRFLPASVDRVRPEDHNLLEGQEVSRDSDEDKRQNESQRTAMDRNEANLGRSRHHVWIEEGELLRAVEVWTGLSDYQYTELVSGQLKEGDALVTGIAAKP